MKKIFYFFFMIVFSAGFFSCQKEEAVEVTPNMALIGEYSAISNIVLPLTDTTLIIRKVKPLGNVSITELRDFLYINIAPTVQISDLTELENGFGYTFNIPSQQVSYESREVQNGTPVINVVKGGIQGYDAFGLEGVSCNGLFSKASETITLYYISPMQFYMATGLLDETIDLLSDKEKTDILAVISKIQGKDYPLPYFRTVVAACPYILTQVVMKKYQ
ncbi:MAG: hypothetical protein MJZ61_07220 [Bacteroidales bacterium]|nr:hypothetical protein [Bacteroidales bacterium]